MKPETEEILAELLDRDLDANQKETLLKKIEQNQEAMDTYYMIMATEDFVSDMPLEEPSMSFERNVLMGFDREQLRKKNNRLITWFAAVAASIVVFLTASFGGASTTVPSLPSEYQEGLPFSFDWFAGLTSSGSMIQLILVVNAILLVLVLERWFSRKRYLGLSSFFLGL